MNNPTGRFTRGTGPNLQSITPRTPEFAAIRGAMTGRVEFPSPPVQVPKITMAEVFARAAAKNRQTAEESEAWRKTPEGQEWEAQQRRLADADTRYAEEHPPADDEADDEADDC